MPPDPETLRRDIREAAAERVRLHAEGARTPSVPPELAARYAENGKFLEKLTAPEALVRLASGDDEALGYAVCFLEVYPFCPDSGFAIRDLVKALRETAIPETYLPRLRAALLGIASQPPRDEMKHLRRLAFRVADEAFVAELDRIATSEDIPVAEGARALAAYIVKRWNESA